MVDYDAAAAVGLSYNKPLHRLPAEPSRLAVEADRVVPPSGNLWIGGQHVWLGPARAGRTVTTLADQVSLHVLLDGVGLKATRGSEVARVLAMSAAGTLGGGCR